MSDVPVHYAPNELDAQTAAGALRANGLRPRVARDDADAMLGVAGGISVGRWIVFVREGEARRAREVLQTPEVREPPDQPAVRLFVIAGMITALLFGAGLVARACLAP